MLRTSDCVNCDIPILQEPCLAMVLAGGEGRRLAPLTLSRAKPAVPFGGRYRIIDFVLSNFVNSGFYRVKMLTQYKATSLIQHIMKGWHLPWAMGHYIEMVPAQMRTGGEWYRGSADAIFQNLNLIRDDHPEHVFVFGGDHVYKMDIRQMLNFHVLKEAELTVAAIPVPLAEGSEFGIIEADADGAMIGFEEKPAHPKPMPGNPEKCLASMGNYLFRTDYLVDAVSVVAGGERVADFGRDILTQAYQKSRVFVYDFANNTVPGMAEPERGYWRDVGTIDAYFASNMDLVAVSPEFNLYNYLWPIRTAYDHHPPAKFVFSDERSARIGIATNSLVSEGCIISGGQIDRCILSPRVRINSYSQVQDSVLFENVSVGRHCSLRRVIVDKNVEVPPGTIIGHDPDKDRERFFVSPGGVVVIPKGYDFSAPRGASPD